QASTQATIFVVSTCAPLTQLATYIYEYIARSHWLEVIGEIINKDRSAPTTVSSLARSDFLPAVEQRPEYLTDVLEALARQLHKPLLIILDQAEEVFTLEPRQDGDVYRDNLFCFLESFCRRQFWIKVLLSMRTEFYGRFESHIRKRLGEYWPVGSFFIEPLDKKLLIKAIEEPTEPTLSTREWIDFGYEKDAEKDAAEYLATEIMQHFPGPGRLTAFQVVCRRLYAALETGDLDIAIEEGVKRRTALQGVRHRLYVALNLKKADKLLVTEDGVAEKITVGDCIEDYLNTLLVEFYRAACIPPFVAWRNLHQLVSVLSYLVLYQADGTPLTNYRNRLEFEVYGEKHYPGFPWSEFIDFGIRDDIRVLKQQIVHVVGAAAPELMVSLGHDILALAVAKNERRTPQMGAWLKGRVFRLLPLFISGAVMLLVISLAWNLIKESFFLLLPIAIGHLWFLDWLSSLFSRSDLFTPYHLAKSSNLRVRERLFFMSLLIIPRSGKWLPGGYERIVAFYAALRKEMDNNKGTTSPSEGTRHGPIRGLRYDEHKTDEDRVVVEARPTEAI
ncbi:MAG: hypothetical protein ACREXR_01990, partial [Gammaproteobacteria bacterium]